MEAIDLTTEYVHDPMGLSVTAPRFSWRMDAAAPGRQVAYQIEVADLATGDDGGPVLWDSQRVDSASQILVPYAGTSLKSRQRCRWRVRLWTEPVAAAGGDATPGPWSEAASFEMGLLHPTDWNGTTWITEAAAPSVEDFRLDSGATKRPWARRRRPSADRPSPIIRRDFVVDGDQDLSSARLYCSALGLYEIEINGKAVSEDRLRPGFTAYGKRIQYQTYDVSSLLVPGANAVGITLADGWWRGRVGVFRRPNNWGSEVAAIARIEAGGETLVETGPGWRSTVGGVSRSCLFHGERFDSRDQPQGWTEPGFHDTDWSTAPVFDGPTGALLAQVGPSVRVIERIPAERVFQTPAGETVVDFGVNLAGVVEFSVAGSPGSKVRLTHGETLTADGNFTADTFGEARQEVHYTLAGHPEGEGYAARFTYHGFRYARVDEWPEGRSPTAGDFTALVLSSDTPTVGEFECSHPGLNQLMANIDRSQVANFIDIPTDCPTREKAGWTGDIAVFGRTGALNRQIAPLLTRWLGDVRSDQLDDGRIPCVVPVSASYNTFFMRPTHGGAAWADACVDVPWMLYVHYGDVRVLEENFSMMQHWVEALERRARRNPWWATIDPRAHMGEGRGRQQVIEQGFQWAEWLPPGETLTKNWLRGMFRPDPLVATAYYARTLQRVGRIAEVLGHHGEAERLAAQKIEVVAAVREHLFADDGLPQRRDQVGLVCALAFGLIEESNLAFASRALADRVRADRSRLATGFTMTPLLCSTLVETGNIELAYDVLLGTEVPSWLYPITKGATTIWETWDAIAPDGTVSDVSQNHYAFGAVGEFLHRYVVGIDTDPTRVGYEHVVIRPVPDPARRITQARAALSTGRGVVSANWSLEGGQLVLDATIPPGATATIVAGTTSREVGPGTHRIVGDM